MAILQVKHVPDEVYDALKDRATHEHTTVSELVIRVLRRELSLPSMTSWLDELRQLPERTADIDVVSVLDEIRSDDA